MSQLKKEQISVEYVDHMGSDLTVVNAARASFDKQKDVFEDNDIGLLRFLATGFRTKEWAAFLDQIKQAAGEHGTDGQLTKLLHDYKRKAQHWAPFAHGQVEIRMTIPLFLARQLVKHQIGGTWSEVSRRYVSDTPSFWFPDQWHTRPEDIKQGSGDSVENQELMNMVSEVAVINALGTYEMMLKQGVAPEEARIVLPQNMMTTVVWTGSLLFWARIMWQRGDSHAQLPAQEFARKLDPIVSKLFPQSWKALTQ